MIWLSRYRWYVSHRSSPREWFNGGAARANVWLMRRDQRGAWATSAVWLLAALLPVGCKKPASDAPQVHGAAEGAHPQAAAPPVGDADMVAAVSNVSSDTPINLKFRLASRPEVGKPLTIELELVPDAGQQIQHIHMAFQAGEGLDVQGEQRLDIDAHAAESTVHHDLTVVPRHAGVLQLHATAVVDTSSASLARSYGIPVITFDVPPSVPVSHSVPD